MGIPISFPLMDLGRFFLCVVDVGVDSNYASGNKYENLSKNTRFNFINKKVLGRIKVCI